jgi:probable HAF family extracellular repeat protein
MKDLGTLGGNNSGAEAINAGGQVVGESDISGGTAYHAFLYTNGIMKDLGTLGGDDSTAYGINDVGQVVGFADIAGNYSRAFVYGNGTMQDLNSMISSSKWTLTDAMAINDNGWIVGYGTNPDGYTHAFLLTPIPEPSTFALLGIGAIGLTGWASRRRKRSKG